MDITFMYHVDNKTQHCLIGVESPLKFTSNFQPNFVLCILMVLIFYPFLNGIDSPLLQVESGKQSEDKPFQPHSYRKAFPP